MKPNLDVLNRRIREKGYRLTRQRQIVLEELAKVDFHPRADQIYQMVRRRIPNISFGTIYRNLKTLQELGLLAELQYGSKSARFDANIGAHQHFVCLQCDKIIDVDEDFGLDMEIPGLKRMGYQVEGYRLQLLGHCPSCRKKTDKK
jgi:Fe2+ or Zn2+ uptake regulation protein